MRKRARSHLPMADLAARQYGVVTRAQLADLGYTDTLLERALRRGTLQAWHRDVFAVGHGGLSPHGLCQAAVLFRGEGALISHQSAVWLWGLEARLEIPVNVTVPRRGSSRAAVGLHHCLGLREEDRASTERLPVTAVPRTLLDYAWTAKQHRLELAIGRADDLDLLDRAAVDRVIEETPAHPGGPALRRALAFHRENGAGLSGAEREMLAVLRESAVPPPQVRAVIDGCRLDFYWPRERLAVELRTWRNQPPDRTPEEGRRREGRLKAAGIETIEVTRIGLRHEPRRVASGIALRLERRRHAEAA